MIAYPCGVCNKSVASNHRAIECDLCKKWIHLKCNKLADKDYKFYQDANNADEQFFASIVLLKTSLFPDLIVMNL